MFKWIKRLLLLIVVALGIWWYGSLPDSTIPNKPNNQLRMVAANVLYANDQSTALRETLLGLDADVLVLIEWHPNLLPAASFTGYKVITQIGQQPVAGMLVLAKAHLAAKGIEQAMPVDSPCAFPMAHFNFTWQQRTFSAYGIHAPPPVKACANGNLPALRHVAQQLRGGRLQQDSLISMTGELTFVLGDLNAFPFSKGIKALHDAGVRDSFDEANIRPGPTWGFDWSLDFARIDYIFRPPSVKTVNSWTIRLPGSDHRAVVSDFALGPIEVLTRNPNL